MRSTLSKGSLAAVAVGSVLAGTPVVSGAQEEPIEPTVDAIVGTEENQGETGEPGADPNAPAGPASCGLFARWEEKMVATVNFPFVGEKSFDVFKQGLRHGVCENDEVLTNLYASDHVCTKYSWVSVVYRSTKQFEGLPSKTPNTTSANSNAKCGMKVGGSLFGVELSYSKMVVFPHSYYMSNKAARGNRGSSYTTNY